MQWIYPIYSLLLVLNIVIISEEDAVTLPETVRLLVRATRVRKHVLAQPDQVSREDRCRYTDFSRREESRTVTPRDGVKILGNGELTKKLTVKADAFSEGAKAKIEALGGTCEVI